jgi:hypothetical protein
MDSQNLRNDRLAGRYAVFLDLAEPVVRLIVNSVRALPPLCNMPA